MNRRKFLQKSGCAAITAATMSASIQKLGEISAMAQGVSGYKALVCIFLSGGNDCNNLVVPFNAADGYTEYNNVRGASALALPQSTLVGPMTPASLAGRQFGLHPMLSPEVANPTQPFAGLKAIWDAGKMAVVCNVGNLVQPISKAQYQAGIGRPYSLFSHSDQVAQQQSSQSTVPSAIGWGGRVADALNGSNGATPSLPMVTSISGTSLFTIGQVAKPLAIGDSNTPLANVLRLVMTGTPAEQTARRTAFDQIRNGGDGGSYLVKASNDTVSQALAASAALAAASPTIATTFPNTGLGRQLLQIARLIKVQSALGMSRQIFFAQIGGFDNHSNQTSTNPTTIGAAGGQGNLFQQLSQAMRAFYDEMGVQNMSNNVTQFTLSDFGRTFQPAGSGAASVGSDHAWGSHHIVLGGAVRGGDFYGTFPTLQLGGPNDTDTRGRWIPTTSIDQYAATLAQWYGLPSAQANTVFPFLSRFPSSNLGFMM